MAVLADHALVDQHGKLSVIGIWRNVILSQLPGVHPRAHLVLLLAGGIDDVGEHRVTLSLIDPSGTARLEHHGAMQLHEPDPGITEIEAPGVIVLDLPVDAVGPHAIVVALDDVEAARVPFMVSMPRKHQALVH